MASGSADQEDGARALLQAGGSALVLVLMMLVGGLVLWIGVPLVWLYVGSQVQAATDSIGAALVVMAVGIALSIALIVLALGWLNEKYAELRAARGLDDLGNVALEAVLAVSAAVALVSFGVWFFLFAGTSPIPINITT